MKVLESAEQALAAAELARQNLLARLEVLVAHVRSRFPLHRQDWEAVEEDLSRAEDTQETARTILESLVQAPGQGPRTESADSPPADALKGGPEDLRELLGWLRRERLRSDLESYRRTYLELQRWGVPGAADILCALDAGGEEGGGPATSQISDARLREYGWGIRLHALLKAFEEGAPFALDRAAEIPGIADHLERLRFVVQVGTGRLTLARSRAGVVEGTKASPAEAVEAPSTPEGPVQAPQEPLDGPVATWSPEDDIRSTAETILTGPDATPYPARSVGFETGEPIGTPSHEPIHSVLEPELSLRPQTNQLPDRPEVDPSPSMQTNEVSVPQLDEAARLQLLHAALQETDAGTRLRLLAEIQPSVPPESEVQVRAILAMAEEFIRGRDLLAAMVLRAAVDSAVADTGVPPANVLRCFLDRDPLEVDQILETRPQDVSDDVVKAAMAMVATTAFLSTGDYRLADWINAVPEDLYPLLAEAGRNLLTPQFDLEIEVTLEADASEENNLARKNLLDLLTKLEAIEPKLISPGSRVTLKRLKKEGASLQEGILSGEEETERQAMARMANVVGRVGEADSALGELFDALFKEGAHEQRALKNDDRRIVRSWFDRVSRALHEYQKSVARCQPRQRKTIPAAQRWHEAHHPQLHQEIQDLSARLPWVDARVFARFGDAFRDRCFRGGQ